MRRTGESGRGSEVLDFLPLGLGARPGPTDWLNFGNDGVGGVKVVEFCVPALRPPAKPVGVKEGGRSRRNAFVVGTKMPAPGTDVLKYDTLKQTKGR